MNTGRSVGNKEDDDKETGQQLQQHIAANNDDGSVNMGLKPPVFRSRHLLYEKFLPGNHLPNIVLIVIWC